MSPCWYARWRSQTKPCNNKNSTTFSTCRLTFRFTHQPDTNNSSCGVYTSWNPVRNYWITVLVLLHACVLPCRERLNPLKHDVHLNAVLKIQFLPQRKTMLLLYKDQAVDTAYGNNACCTKQILHYVENRLFNVKADCVCTCISTFIYTYARNFLTSREPVSFSRSTLLLGVSK